ncbi:eukaryotic translation initiation factor 2D-like [Symsagittifera roscoffensis]|uniref:eukaryotic translation initiation factor 2D-like n=1 Tax=Symsagittifera roscoffensis TaxID=84072 RepID=UPI00307B1A01
MFSKSIKLKSDNMTKLGERKKLKQQAIKDWSLLKSDETVSMDIVEDLFSTKDPLYTKKYQVAERQQITVYSSSSNSIAFEHDNLLVPSLFSLWKLKLDRPLFIVAPPVIEILSRGASLMAPGVLNWDTITSFDRGDLCFIVAHGSNIPTVIAALLMSLEEVRSCGFKGKLANVLHMVGDELFKLGRQKVPTEEEYLLCKCDEQLASNGDNTEINEVSVSELKLDENQTSESVAEEAKTMEEILEICLLTALKLCKNSFPILCSTFQGQFLIPACPDGYSVDVKKSRFKKMSVFYKEYEEKGLIKISVSDKDVWSIASADLSHIIFRGFKPMKVVSPSAKNVEDEEDDSNVDFLQTFVFPEITSVYIASKPFSNVFKHVEKGVVLTANEVRQDVKDYVLAHCETGSSGVLLDPPLASFLLKKNENLSHLSWQDVNQRSIDALQPAYQIKGGSFLKEVLVKGQSHPVLKVTTHKRAGNKHVTLIQNLEKFGINMKQFARFLQNLAASSSSATTDKATKCEIVQVQGNQVKLLRKLFLEQLKFPVKCIDIPNK